MFGAGTGQWLDFGTSCSCSTAGLEQDGILAPDIGWQRIAGEGSGSYLAGNQKPVCNWSVNFMGQGASTVGKNPWLTFGDLSFILWHPIWSHSLPGILLRIGPEVNSKHQGCGPKSLPYHQSANFTLFYFVTLNKYLTAWLNIAISVETQLPCDFLNI